MGDKIPECYKEDCSNKAKLRCQRCSRFTCEEHGEMRKGEWVCEEHGTAEIDGETFYDLAKFAYESYLQRRVRISTRAFEMVRVSGMITSILGAVAIFTLLNYQSIYLALLLPGLVTLLASIIVYLPLWRIPSFRTLDLKQLETEFEEERLEKTKIARRLMEITKWYRDELLPPIRKTIELQNKLTKVGVIISIGGIIIIFLLELLIP